MKHTIILTATGKVWGMGDNKFSQIGNRDEITTICLSPTLIHLNDITVSDIHCGSNHSLFVSKDRKKIVAQGRNNYGQLGTELPCVRNEIPLKSQLKQLAVGSEHNLALLESGELYAWGWNEHGQLGLGDEEHYFTPTLHTDLYSSVFCGAAQCFASV